MRIRFVTSRLPSTDQETFIGQEIAEMEKLGIQPLILLVRPSTTLLRRQPLSNSVACGAADLSCNPRLKGHKRPLLRFNCHALIWQSSKGKAPCKEVARCLTGRRVRIDLASWQILVMTVAVLCRVPLKVAKIVAEAFCASRLPRALVKNSIVIPLNPRVAGECSSLGISHVDAVWASTPATVAFVMSRSLGVPWSFCAHRWDIR